MLNSKFSALSSLVLLSLYSTSVRAANDWSKPCFDGVCSYDLPDTPAGPSGTLKIWGTNSSIADITPAGGWEIIGCDPDKEEQDIRIVCKGIDMDGDGDNDGCSHLFAEGSGTSFGGNSTTASSLPVPTGTVVEVGNDPRIADTGDEEDQRATGKIVRLPQECGKQAFGRIAKAWTHEDQTVPSHISKRLLLPLHRRSKHIHKVKGITIDTQFQKTDRAKHGSVNFQIFSGNVPKASGNPVGSSLGKRLVEEPLKKRNVIHSRIFTQRRGWGDIVHDIGDAVGDGAGAVGDAISDGAGAVGGVISDGAGAVGDAAGAVGDAISGEKQFNNTISNPLDISKTFTLFQESIDCSTGAGNGSILDPKFDVNGKLGVDVEADLKGTVDITIAASGSLTDLRADSFDLSTTLTADLNGVITLSAGVGGSIDSGKIKFYELPLAGLDFPGIFSVGPTFQINGNAKVSLNVDTDMRIGVVYHIGSVQFDFPNGGLKSGTFSPGDTPIQLSAQPSAGAVGKVEAHLIPSLNFGISAFAGATTAEVFVNLDASASMTLTGDATLPSIQANITRREPTVEITRRSVRGSGPIGELYFNKRSLVPKQFASDLPTSDLPTTTPAAGNLTSPSAVPQSTDSAVATMTSEPSMTILADVNSTSTAVPQATDSAAATVTSDQSMSILTAGNSTSTSTAPMATNSGISMVVNNDVTFGGCLEMGASLVANVGADANFFGLFDPSKTIPLFQKQFSLFKKCFGDKQTRRAMPILEPRHPVLVGRDLQCNDKSVDVIEDLANLLVKAADIF